MEDTVREKGLTLLLSSLVLVAFAAGQSVKEQAMPSDADIRQILVDRIDVQHQSVGIVVGIVGPEGRRVISYGHLEKDDARPLNGDTIFEIGSATKVFTSLLLADMVQHGEVALNDPVAKYLPQTVKVPERNGKQITLIDLATHTSGLPRMPTNFAPKDANNPYADYSEEQLYQFLAGYQLTRDIGTKYEYSNLGAGLLGLALTRRARMDYEQLVRSRICNPLGMNSTTVTLTPEMKRRLAVGHNQKLEAVENWDIGPATAGAGALRSTANDLLTFLAANLGYTKTPLAPAMAAMLTTRRPTGMPTMEVALGWHIYSGGSKEIVEHNGGTGGYRTYMGFDPKSRVGVVVLSNAETTDGVDDIGRHLLDASVALMRPHTEAQIDPKIFDSYIGYYQLAPNFILAVTRDGDHFMTQATGQGKLEIFPESDHEFFAKAVNAQITFVTDSTGRAIEVILHQGGLDLHASRIEGPLPPAAPREHTEVHVDPKVLDSYVGSYQLSPNFEITISREGDHLFEQATGQPKFEIFPESEKDFFLKVVDAQITFVTNSEGRAAGLVLHQNGRDIPGNRVE